MTTRASHLLMLSTSSDRPCLRPWTMPPTKTMASSTSKRLKGGLAMPFQSSRFQVAESVTYRLRVGYLALDVPNEKLLKLWPGLKGRNADLLQSLPVLHPTARIEDYCVAGAQALEDFGFGAA